MPELNTTTLSDFVRLAPIIFFKEAESLNQAARQSGLFLEERIPANSGNTRDYTEIDGEEYAAVKEEGDQATRAQVQQGFTTTLTQYRVAKDISITFEMRSQNKYPQVIARLTNLARQAFNRIDLDLSHWIGFGTATSYVDMDGRTVTISGGDSLSLFNTAHTLRGSTSTYRNRIANNPQLSKGSLELMETMVVENTLNQFGEKQVITWDKLWTTDDPTHINIARELLQSTASVGSGDNSGVVNVNKAKYQHVILPRVATTNVGAVDASKNKYWGLASTMIRSAVLAMFEEPRLKTPSTTDSAEEFSTDDWSFGVRAGYGITVPSGRGWTLSTGDGVV